MYKRAFKKLRYLEWVSMQLQIKVSDIFMNTFEIQKKQKTPTLVLVYEKGKNNTELELFKKNYEIFYENLDGKICDIKDWGCKTFLKELPISFENNYPKIFIMAFNENIKVPLFYLMKNNIDLDNFRNFVNGFKNKKIKFDVFSEESKEIYDGENNDKAFMISRNSFRDFFVENFGKDKIILFYSSHCTECSKIKTIFQVYSKKTLINEANKKNISLGYFDMAKNSHEIFFASDKDCFLRFYKINEFKTYHDIKIDVKKVDKFLLRLKNFVSDSSTQRIEDDEEIIDEM